jgi:hypothetical protein
VEARPFEVRCRRALLRMIEHNEFDLSPMACCYEQTACARVSMLFGTQQGLVDPKAAMPKRPQPFASRLFAQYWRRLPAPKEYCKRHQEAERPDRKTDFSAHFARSCADCLVSLRNSRGITGPAQCGV